MLKYIQKIKFYNNNQGITLVSFHLVFYYLTRTNINTLVVWILVKA